MTPAIDHEAAALARLAQYLKGKPKFAALLATATDGHNELETALRQILTDTTLDASVGAQLDDIGEIVGLARQGVEDDEIYRVLLKAKIKVNRSRGTIEDLVQIFRLVAAVTPATAAEMSTWAFEENAEVLDAGMQAIDTDGRVWELRTGVTVSTLRFEYIVDGPDFMAGDMVQGVTGNVYVCTVSGTGAGMGPLSTDDDVVSGTAHFRYLGPSSDFFVYAGDGAPYEKGTKGGAQTLVWDAVEPGAVEDVPHDLTRDPAFINPELFVPFEVAGGGDETPTTVEEEEQPPAGFVVRLLDQPQDPELIPFFAGFLRDARAAGVRGLLEWAESPSGDMFRFDSGPGFDQGHLAGAID